MDRAKVVWFTLKLFGWLWPGILASILAVAISYYIVNGNTEVVRVAAAEHSTPCTQRPCFAKIIERVSANEQRINDMDAELRKNIDRLDDSNRKAIEALRIEFNKRIDTMRAKE